MSLIAVYHNKQTGKQCISVSHFNSPRLILTRKSYFLLLQSRSEIIFRQGLRLTKTLTNRWKRKTCKEATTNGSCRVEIGDDYGCWSAILEPYSFTASCTAILEH